MHSLALECPKHVTWCESVHLACRGRKMSHRQLHFHTHTSNMAAHSDLTEEVNKPTETPKTSSPHMHTFTDNNAWKALLPHFYFYIETDSSTISSENQAVSLLK